MGLWHLHSLMHQGQEELPANWIPYGSFLNDGEIQNYRTLPRYLLWILVCR